MFTLGITSECFNQQATPSSSLHSQIEIFNQDLSAGFVDDTTGLLVLWEATQIPDIYILAYEKPIGNYLALNLGLRDLKLACFISMLDIIVKQVLIFLYNEVMNPKC